MAHHQEAASIKQEPDCETPGNSDTQFPFQAEYLKQEWKYCTDDSDVYTEGLNASVRTADILETTLCEDLIQPGLCIKHEGMTAHDKDVGVMEVMHKKDYPSVTVLTYTSCRESRSAEGSAVCRHSETDMSDTQTDDVTTDSPGTEAGEEVSHSENMTDVSGSGTVHDPQKLQTDMSGPGTVRDPQKLQTDMPGSGTAHDQQKLQTDMSGSGTVHDPQKLQTDRKYSTRGDGCNLSLASPQQLFTRQQIIEMSDTSVVAGAGSTQGGSKISHTRTKPHTCDVCGVGFRSPCELKTHTLIHAGEKPYKCDVCGAGFSWLNSVTTHKRKHTGVKPYKCEFCDAAFFNTGSLITHTRTHTGEKPYKCDICAVGFSTVCSLKRHKRTHTGERPYKCDICAVEYSTSYSLKRHRRIHKV